MGACRRKLQLGTLSALDGLGRIFCTFMWDVVSCILPVAILFIDVIGLCFLAVLFLV